MGLNHSFYYFFLISSNYFHVSDIILFFSVCFYLNRSELFSINWFYVLFENTYNLFPHTACMMVLWFMYLYYMFKGLIEKIGSVLITKLKNRVILSDYSVLNNEHNLISDSNCNQLLVLEFSSNLSFILWKIPTIVLVLCKGHSCECNCFVQLIGSVYSLFFLVGINYLSCMIRKGGWKCDCMVLCLNLLK